MAHISHTILPSRLSGLALFEVRVLSEDLSYRIELFVLRVRRAKDSLALASRSCVMLLYVGYQASYRIFGKRQRLYHLRMVA